MAWWQLWQARSCQHKAVSLVQDRVSAESWSWCNNVEHDRARGSLVLFNPLLKVLPLLMRVAALLA